MLRSPGSAWPPAPPATAPGQLDRHGQQRVAEAQLAGLGLDVHLVDDGRGAVHDELEVADDDAVDRPDEHVAVVEHGQRGPVGDRRVLVEQLRPAAGVDERGACGLLQGPSAPASSTTAPRTTGSIIRRAAGRSCRGPCAARGAATRRRRRAQLVGRQPRRRWTMWLAARSRTRRSARSASTMAAGDRLGDVIAVRGRRVGRPAARRRRRRRRPTIDAMSGRPVTAVTGRRPTPATARVGRRRRPQPTHRATMTRLRRPVGEVRGQRSAEDRAGVVADRAHRRRGARAGSSSGTAARRPASAAAGRRARCGRRAPPRPRSPPPRP